MQAGGNSGEDAHQIAEELKELKELFYALDKDGDDKIRLDNFLAALELMGSVVDQSAVAKIMETIDANQDGMIDFGNFCTLMEGFWTNYVERSVVKRFFDAFDVDGSGDVPTAQMRHVMTKLGFGSQ